MARIPSNLSRAPNILVSQINLRSITGTNTELLRLNSQIAAQKRVINPSDDPVAAALIGALDSDLEAGEQKGRNLEHASSTLNTLDQTLGGLSDLVLEAKTIASSQIGVGSDAATRAQQADVVDSLLNGVYASMNRSFVGMYLFGGDRVAAPPIESFGGGYRFVGSRQGMHTDIGPEIDFPITLSADQATGALSARVEGSVDLEPSLTASTRLQDLRGPMEGKQLGLLAITINDGVTPVTVQVDLSGAETVGDVANLIESTIRSTDPAALGGAFPAGVTPGTAQFSLNAVAAGYSITFADGPAGETATALGLAGFIYDASNPENTASTADLDPKLTDQTTLGSLGPSTAVAFGDIVFRNGGRAGTVTTSAGMTIGEFKEAVRRLNVGVRVEIDGSGDSLNVVNEVSGFRMSIEEGGGTAATTLGIRSFSAASRLEDFNDGRGVSIADGQVDPLTNLPDPDQNLDFRITLTDGSTFDVDLTPTDIGTVQDVIDKINADAATAGFGAVFSASLGTGANGIVLNDTSAGAGTISVTSLNGYAAEDLGLLGGTFTAGATATYRGGDTATVRVDSLFSTLMDLRDALRNNDERGITFAGERLEDDLDRLASARALVGGRASRVEAAQARLDDTTVLNTSLKSERQDLDLIEASSRFSLLQTQLQATLTAVAQSSRLSLLDFLS